MTKQEKLKKAIALLDECLRTKWAPELNGPNLSYLCALCGEYTVCKGCPIAMDSGRGCKGTPYYSREAMKLRVDFIGPDQYKNIVKEQYLRMREYLISLKQELEDHLDG